MRKCVDCGGPIKRVHRTLLQRFRYVAIYECCRCKLQQSVPSHYLSQLGAESRCPKCGTYRIVRLNQPDKIDPMYSGLSNALERWSGGRLYHCRFCRLQFYDRRPMTERSSSKASAQPEPLTGQDAAG